MHNSEPHTCVKKESVTRRTLFKDKNNTFCMSADGFHKFLAVPLLASVKSLTNCENPSMACMDPLQKAGSGFLIAACDSISCSKSRLKSWAGSKTSFNLPAIMECRLCFQLGTLFRKTALNVHLKKLTYNREEKPEQKYYVVFGTVLRIRNCFRRSKHRHLIFVSLFNKV